MIIHVDVIINRCEHNRQDILNIILFYLEMCIWKILKFPGTQVFN